MTASSFGMSAIFHDPMLKKTGTGLQAVLARMLSIALKVPSLV